VTRKTLKKYVKIKNLSFRKPYEYDSNVVTRSWAHIGPCLVRLIGEMMSKISKLHRKEEKLHEKAESAMKKDKKVHEKIEKLDKKKKGRK